MGLYVGGYDPIKLVEGLLNTLLARGMITKQEADAIVAAARAPEQ